MLSLPHDEGDICPVPDPKVNANCGRPVSAKGRSKKSRTPISSPTSYVESLAGVVVNHTSLTTGAPATLPSTLCAALFEIAWLPRPSAALVVPCPTTRTWPSQQSASAAMLIPFASESEGDTTYSNSSDDVPPPRA